MNDAKRDKKVVQLDREESKEDKKLKSVAPSRKIYKRVFSFDAYFQGLMRENSKIYPHHKAPMKKYAESKGLTEATKEDFDRIFRLY